MSDAHYDCMFMADDRNQQTKPVGLGEVRQFFSEQAWFVLASPITRKLLVVQAGN